MYRHSLVVDTILHWHGRCPDGSQILQSALAGLSGLSAEQALGSDGSCDSSRRPPRILETFLKLEFCKAVRVEGAFRRFDGEFRWFLFRVVLCATDRESREWYGTNTILRTGSVLKMPLEKEER